MTLVLASTSTIRSAVLTAAGVIHRTARPLVNETQLKFQHRALQPRELSHVLARDKAKSVSRSNPQELVLGADQVLVLDGKVYDKPADRIDARRQLHDLRGKAHNLLSSLSCCRNDQEIWSCTEVATLHMRSFSDRFLESYLDAMGEEVKTSVGAYKLEALGIQLFEAVEGDHFTILGLPLLPLLAFLRREGEIAA